MKLASNPRYDVLLVELQNLGRPFSKWRGLLFRSSCLPYAQAAKLLDGKGSLTHGGRWSAPGTFSAVNLSTAQETAIAESGASFTYYNFAPSDVRPKVIVAVRANFSKVLDLIAPKGLRTKTWLELDKLLVEDWHKVNDAKHESQSQAFGRAAHAVGAEALLVPSARVPGGMNLVYFPQSLARGSKVEILGENDLNRWLKKR